MVLDGEIQLKKIKRNKNNQWGNHNLYSFSI